jgi:hypothetical protein
MKWQTNLPCVACGRYTENGNALHHVLTRKAHPELKDKHYNLMPLCVHHHNMIHSKGARFMCEHFTNICAWLTSNNWYFCETTGKLRHDGE